MIKQFYRFLHPRFQNLFLEYRVDLKPRYGHGNGPHPELNELISAGRKGYAEWLQKALSYRDFLVQVKDLKAENDPSKPAWNNGFLPGLDMVMLYTFLAEGKPARYVEVGSGNSTKLAYKTKMDQGLDTVLTSIDPMPRAEIDVLADKVLRRPLESIDLDLILGLEEGDILFIDNSHRVLPNSDAMVFFMEVLPRLKKGVIVHIHDVYLPYDYPQFMCDRFYSEQYALAINLMANPGRYEVLMPNYFVSEEPELASLLAPLWEHEGLPAVERHGGSFWLRIGA